MPKQSLNVSLNFSTKGGGKLPSNGSIRADFGSGKGSPDSGTDSGSASESDARSSSRASSPPRRYPGRRDPHVFGRGPGHIPRMPPPPAPPGMGRVPGGCREAGSDSDSDSGSEAEPAHVTESDSEDEPMQNKRARNKKSKSKTKTVTAPVGSVSEIKNLYMSRKDRDGNYTWVNEPPSNLHESGENSESDTYAILVRNVKTKGSRKKLQAQSIIIQSPFLKTALADIFAEYPGISTSLKKLVFDAPFRHFVHRWPQLIEYMDSNKASDATGTDAATTAEHLRLLYDLLKQETGDNLEAMEDYVRNGIVTFRHLWMFFEPGCVVLSTKGQMVRAYELKSLIYGQGPNGSGCLFLNTDYVDYNGKRFGRYPAQLKIEEFEGTKKITTLDVFPLRYSEEKEEVEKYLMRRGEVFEGLQGSHFKEYDGPAFGWSRSENEITMQVNGRIVVDAASFARFGEGSVGSGNRLLGRWTFKDIERFRKYREGNGPSTGSGQGEGSSERDKKEDFIGLTPYHRMLANSRTSGYELKFRKWLEFEVDHIREVTFNKDVAKKLVLPDEQKELILAMAESQIEGGSGFDDVIKGKGKGVVCLLSGPPGVGKTLTAEVVAESLHAPLVSLGSGDLGSDASDIENCLLEHLELVARWKGIMLLDECDVFLEARGKNDLVRNQIVSVFLRMLEYYEGLMFMTTNRIDNIDTAFQSRIHVSFEYPDLTVDSRKQIWTKFIESAAESGFRADITDRSIAQLAEIERNGRQVKNIVKTAQLLAARRRERVLTRDIIQTVLEIEKKRPSMGRSNCDTPAEFEVLM